MHSSMSRCCDDGGCGEITSAQAHNTAHTTTPGTTPGTTPVTAPATTGDPTTTTGVAHASPWGQGPERRSCRRTRVHGDAQISFKPRFGEEITTKVSLLDASVGGVGVRSETAVEVGSRFALFPDKVRQSSWTGEVVRCVKDDQGWTIGLHLSQLAA